MSSKSRTQEDKKTKVDSSLAQAVKNQRAYKILCDNKTPFIQALRKAFRQHKSEIIFGKYRIIEKGLSKILPVKCLEVLKGTTTYKKSDKIYMYLFTNLLKEKVTEILNSCPSYDYERRGHPLEQDIILPAGELLNKESIKVSNTLFKEIEKLGLANVIINPKTNNIEMTQETILGLKGDLITEEQEKMIRILGIKNKLFRAEIVAQIDIPQESSE
ncbi:mRNA turnover protein 4 [Nematocida sp. AWRm80]|nr:mRNA turnover protein 4 [Nematocida sp. AWRm80]